MELLSCRVPKDFNLYQIGDAHIGTIAHSRDKWLGHIRIIKKDPLARVVGVGDWIEGKAVDHPLYEEDQSTTPTVYKQCDTVIEDLYPIKNKILCLGEGNHDRYSKRHLGAVKDIICAPRGLDVPFGTWNFIISFLDLKGKLKFKGNFTHGNEKGGLRSEAENPLREKISLKISLVKALSRSFGDCLINGCGHYHRFVTFSPSEAVTLFLVSLKDDVSQRYTTPSHDDREFIPVYERWYAASGSYLKQFVRGVSTYGERHGYKPTELGMIRWVIRNYKPVKIEEVK